MKKSTLFVTFLLSVFSLMAQDRIQDYREPLSCCKYVFLNNKAFVLSFLAKRNLQVCDRQFANAEASGVSSQPDFVDEPFATTFPSLIECPSSPTLPTVPFIAKIFRQLTYLTLKKGIR
ncbi:MAG: hypothetical protein R2825_24990 [Saprospiraceae bacterium]